MTVYYRVITVWCKWPFNDVVDEKYCEFSKSKGHFDKQKLPFRMESNTSIEQKQEFVKEKLNLNSVTIKKL